MNAVGQKIYDLFRGIGDPRLLHGVGLVRKAVDNLAEARRQGFGDLLVRLLLFKALTHSARVIRLSCSEETAPFFARYGFTADPNESPEEGAPIVMSIRGADVRLSGCGGACDGCGRRGEESKP